MPTIGKGSHTVNFSHPLAGDLTLMTGINNISWGYQLNTANFPTYGGEVVQILSCYVDDLLVQGVLRNYEEMEILHSYFLKYLKMASTSQRKGLEEPMTFSYPHRGWQFKIIVTTLPGYRKALDVVAPEWQLGAFVVDDENDIEDLKQSIIEEAQIKTQIQTDDPAFNENFGLEGKIRYVAENPFSDPYTDQGLNFAANRTESLQHIGDYYSTLLPAYLNGDFDTIFGNVGSQPSFSPKISPQGTVDPDAANRIKVINATKGK